jgi:hypothetical protein
MNTQWEVEVKHTFLTLALGQLHAVACFGSNICRMGPRVSLGVVTGKYAALCQCQTLAVQAVATHIPMSNVQFLCTFSSVEHIYNIAFQHPAALIHGSRAAWTKVKS